MARERRSINGKYLRNGKEINIPTPATPIKDKEDLYKIRQALNGEVGEKPPHKKYLILFELACGLGLRIQDTLSLTVEEVLSSDEKYEQKTGKKHLIALNDRLRRLVEDYVKEFDLNDNDKLIFANRKDGSKTESIDKSQAYRKLKEIVEGVCPHVHFSNHTTRKTWAYQFYIKCDKNIAKVQKVMGHSSSLVTMDYLGLSKAELREELEQFDPFE